MANTTWTAYVKFPNGDLEEIDVVASSRTEALQEVEEVLADEYLPGGVILKLAPLAGVTITSYSI
jgi:hypothetical protein